MLYIAVASIKMTIGLIREEKKPQDNRVAFTPQQCKWLRENYNNLKIIVQPSPTRCFSNEEYKRYGAEINENLTECDIIFGIKEIPKQNLLANKTYLFFSHTKKLQPHNQSLFKEIIKKQITLIDYECMTFEDGQRILGFGFFAGVVGAHNGMMAFGQRTNSFNLHRVYQKKDLQQLIHTYFGLKIPPIKIAVTGSGRVAHGIIEVMNLMQIKEVEPDDYLQIDKFNYPVYTQLKGGDLYQHKVLKTYNRNHFHNNPTEYESLFKHYLVCTDVLMNGVYWDTEIPRLFEKEDISKANFNIKTIADITDDENGSVPINLGDQTIEDPVYGVDKINLKKCDAYLENSVDIMAVGNLPNELPRDASKYFGEQLIKHIFPDILDIGSSMLERATICFKGNLMPNFDYMKNYGGL